ncbi:hypothetical protein C8R46DRAFT_881283 [Mycena filopes]|nr:hypothetical protein C8R46DRAFT_881283 [Mycena filopes]
MIHSHLATLVPRRAQIVPLVTPEECAKYESDIRLPQHTRLEATSADNFRFDVLGTPRSSWNKSAARIFAALAIQQLVLPDNLEMFNAIVKAFETYLDAIIRRYKTSLKSIEQQAQIRSNLSRYGRKYQVCPPLILFHRRRYTSYVFPPLQRHTAMLEQLGVDGMSSDESGDEDHRLEYKILAPVWRASEVAPWIRVFDTVHNILRIAGDPQTAMLQGAFPHRRILGHRKSSSKKFVPGLPQNLYDQDWVAREQLTQYVLYPSPDAYDFTHQPDVIQFVPLLLELPASHLSFRLALHHGQGL